MGKSGPVITLEVMKGAAFYHGLAKLVEDHPKSKVLFSFEWFSKKGKIKTSYSRLFCYLQYFNISILVDGISLKNRFLRL